MKEVVSLKKRIIRLTLKIIAALLALLTSYLALLCFPAPLFHASVSITNLTLYSDLPFSPEEGRKILEMVEAKLATSPFHTLQAHHSVFICNARWRQVLFFNFKYGVGGVNYYPLTSNVFLSGARVEENQLVSPSGHIVEGDRTLDYFITHESAHTITKKAAGWYHHFRLPEYVTEGYADYVAKGAAFDYEKAKQAFVNEAPEMDRWRSGLYLRYHLLVAYLLDKRGWSAQGLLDHPMEQGAVEEAIREEPITYLNVWTGESRDEQASGPGTS